MIQCEELVVVAHQTDNVRSAEEEFQYFRRIWTNTNGIAHVHDDITMLCIQRGQGSECSGEIGVGVRDDAHLCYTVVHAPMTRNFW